MRAAPGYASGTRGSAIDSSALHVSRSIDYSSGSTKRFCQTIQLIVFAREDDYFFGVLHSRAHEVWSLRMGTWLGVGTTRATRRRPASRRFRCRGRRGRSRPTIRACMRSPTPRASWTSCAHDWLNPPDADRGGAEEAHADQPLQRAPDLAGASPRRARPRGLGRLRLGRPTRRRPATRRSWSGCWRSIWSGRDSAIFVPASLRTGNQRSPAEPVQREPEG